MSVTPLGRLLRNVRKSTHELLKDMASALDISVAQLSAIELGKRGMSPDVAEKLLAAYDVPVNREQLSILIDSSQQVYKEDFKDATEKQRDAFVLFARKYKELPETELNTILEKLQK
ncbi:TPA: helix-turn-helix domain-containing protein [Morganella morganii]